MAGRRLADFLALASVTRDVVRQHVRLQAQSVSRAAATSSITKVIKRDFRRTTAPKSVPTPSTTSKTFKGKGEMLLDGKDKEVFYEAKSDGSSSTAPNRGELNTTQENIIAPEGNEKKEYTPASASPADNSKPLNPIQDHHVRKYSTNRSVPSEIAGNTTDSSDLRKNLDEEVFYDTEASTKPNTHNEPDHIPKEAARAPSPQDKLHDGINSEYYYESEEQETKQAPKEHVKSVFARNHLV